MSLKSNQYFYGDEFPISPIPGSNLGQYLLEKMRANGKKIYQIDPETNEQWTYEQTADYTIRVALEMKSRGIKLGSKIALFGFNNLKLILPVYATFLLGATAVPVFPLLEQNGLEDIFTFAKPDMIFCDQKYKKKIENLLKKVKTTAEIVTFEEDFNAFLDKKHQSMVANFKSLPVDVKNTTATILCSSGSTGDVKCIPSTHYALYSGHVVDSAMMPDFDGQEVILTYAPLFWGTALVSHFLAVSRGAKRIVTNYINTEKHFALFNKYEVNFMLTYAAFITAIINDPQFMQSNMKSSLKALVFGGSPALYHEIDKFYESFPDAIIQNILGSTEYTALHITFHPKKDQKLRLENRYAVGKLMPNAVGKLIDETTKEIITEPNKPGELYIKGPSLFKGYLNVPELNKTTFDNKGFYRSGDVFVKNEDGALTYKGRTKDTFKYQEQMIYPFDIENVISQHPAVKETCVFAKPNGFNGVNVPMAFVTKKNGFENTNEEDIIKFVDDKVENYQRLRGGVVFLDEFPILSSGKIRKVELKNMINDMISKGS